MKKTVYLYGIEPEELDGKEYWEALRFKTQEGERLYKYLKEHGPKDREFYCFRALEYTHKLLDEQKEFHYGSVQEEI